MNIKYSIDQRRKAIYDERARRGNLISLEAHHWPLESLEYSYAIACLEIVLLHSDKASHIYDDIMRAWELPGCQALIGGFKDNLPVTNEWKAKAFKARENGKPFPDLPNEWFETYFEHAPAYFDGEAHNTDWEYLLNKMDQLILVGFNRQADQDDQKWKVLPDNAYWLKSVIILRSQAEYCKMKLEDLNKYRPVLIDGKSYDLNAIMEDKPTAGPERKLYRALTDTYQRYKFTLKHDAKLLKDTDKWYKCRVNPGSIEAYIDELNSNGITTPDHPLDQGRVSNDIAACDDATSYPRHK